MTKKLTIEHLISVVEFMLNGMDNSQLLQLSADIAHKKKLLQQLITHHNQQTLHETDLAHGLDFLDVITKATLDIRCVKPE
tara:strand:- start:1645 stop:1887 length:243 start_codon:yes stop_codon:yes gene_type:complete